MSHLTPRDIRNLSQIIDLAIQFMEFTGQRDPALKMILQAIQFFLPAIASMAYSQASEMEIMDDLEHCSEIYFQQGKLSSSEYQKIKYLMSSKN